MDLKQISVFVENKPGRLAELTRFLAEHNIDLRALSVADTKDFGILRLIVDDPDRTAQLLREAGSVVSITYVIGVEVQDEPGALSKILGILADANISVEYVYAFFTRLGQSAYVILRVEDSERAAAILQENGVRLATADDIHRM